MHNTVRIILLCVESKLRVVNLFPVLGESFLRHIFLHFSDFCKRSDTRPEVGALMLVAQSEGVAKLMNDQMLLVLVVRTTIVKVKVHRRL